MEKISYPIRINKYLSIKGYATRRGADELINQGLVLINGKKAKLGDQVNKNDKVLVKNLPDKNYAYYAYNKPLGILTIAEGKNSDKAISDVSDFPIPVFPVGRLDKDSSGLLIMTNDGRITDKLLNPKSNHEKEYRVWVDKPITNTFLKFMKEGVRLGPQKTRLAKVRKISENNFDIILTEGKNRQIRRMCKSLGYEVKKLERFRIGKVELGKLKPGEFREINPKEIF